MYREEVSVQDAVIAVALMESSMQSSALIENVDTLHTDFALDPQHEYHNQGMHLRCSRFTLYVFNESLNIGELSTVSIMKLHCNKTCIS